MLTTERVLLRPLQRDDAELVLALLNDPDFIRFVGDRQIRTVEQARTYIETSKRPDESLLGGYVVVRRADDHGIGLCSFLNRDWTDAPDLGFAFLPEVRGMGLAFEAARCLLDHVQSHGHERVLGITHPANDRSLRLLEKLGFEPVGEITPPDSETTSLVLEVRPDS